MCIPDMALHVIHPAPELVCETYAYGREDVATPWIPSNRPLGVMAHSRGTSPKVCSLHLHKQRTWSADQSLDLPNAFNTADGRPARRGIWWRRMGTGYLAGARRAAQRSC